MRTLCSKQAKLLRVAIISMNKPAILIALIAIAVLLAGCGKPAGQEPQPKVRVEKGAVVFSAGSPQLAAFVTAAAEPQRETTLRFGGRIVWDEDRTGRVFSPLSGRVLTIRARAGDTVKAGDVLATIVSPDLGQAQADARKAEQDHMLALKSLSRIEELHTAGVAPEKDLQTAKADAARAASERDRAEARIKLYGAASSAIDQQFALRSPVSGVVVERNLNPGQEVRPDNPPPDGLFVVSDPRNLWFMLDVAETNISVVHPGLKVQLRATVLGDERMTGRIIQVLDVVDAQSRTIKVRGAVDNSQRRLKAEMFVTAELKVAVARGLLVPAPAVYLRGEQNFVFVETGAGRFERRRVQLGPAVKGDQVVLGGLAAGEKVVVENALLLENLLASHD